jgi:hypothetical protein
VTTIEDAPRELQAGITEYWPPEEWDNAASIARIESDFNPFALNDTTTVAAPCGTYIGERHGVRVVSERSVGYFQINACNFPTWEWQRLYNARHNAGTAHMLWKNAGESWTPWFFSASKLGLI